MNIPQNSMTAPETLSMLRRMIENLETSELTDEDREIIASSWALDESQQRRAVEIGEGWQAMATVVQSDDLAPKLFLCVHAAQTAGVAIEAGLLGAELLAEELFRRCGFDDARIEQILGEMVMQAPTPGPYYLN